MAVPAEHRAPGSNLSSDVALERLRVGQDNSSSRTNVHSLAIGLASNINKHFQQLPWFLPVIPALMQLRQRIVVNLRPAGATK